VAAAVVVVVWAELMLLVVEATLVVAWALRVTMHMSNRCSSSKSMSNNKCVEPRENNLNMAVGADIIWVEAAQLHGRECMMRFPSLNQLPVRVVEEGVVADEVDMVGEAEVEATEDQSHQLLDLKALHRPMHPRDQKMLASLVLIIVEEAEVVRGVSIHTPEDKLLKRCSMMGFLTEGTKRQIMTVI